MVDILISKPQSNGQSSSRGTSIPDGILITPQGKPLQRPPSTAQQSTTQMAAPATKKQSLFQDVTSFFTQTIPSILKDKVAPFISHEYNDPNSIVNKTLGSKYSGLSEYPDQNQVLLKNTARNLIDNTDPVLGASINKIPSAIEAAKGAVKGVAIGSGLQALAGQTWDDIVKSAPMNALFGAAFGGEGEHNPKMTPAHEINGTVQVLDHLKDTGITEGLFRETPTVAKSFIQQVVDRYGMSQKIPLYPKEVEDIFSKDTTSKAQFLQDANIDKKSWSQAVKDNGVIELPTTTVAHLSTKPYWEDLKVTLDRPNVPEVNDVVKSVGDTPKNRAKAYDLSNQYDEMVPKYEQAKVEVDKLADNVAKNFEDSIVAKAPIKGKKRTIEKTMTDLGGDISLIGDGARNTVVVKDPAEVGKVVDMLSKDPNLVKGHVVNSAQDPLGYSGGNVKLKMGNGVNAEIQANTPEMIFAKEAAKDAKSVLGEKLYNQLEKTAQENGLQGGKGHQLYEKVRTILSKKDVGENLTAEELNLLETTAKESKDYYDSFRNLSETRLSNSSLESGKPLPGNAASKNADLSTTKSEAPGFKTNGLAEPSGKRSNLASVPLADTEKSGKADGLSDINNSTPSNSSIPAYQENNKAKVTEKHYLKGVETSPIPKTTNEIKDMLFYDVRKDTPEQIDKAVQDLQKGDTIKVYRATDNPKLTENTYVTPFESRAKMYVDMTEKNRPIQSYTVKVSDLIFDKHSGDLIYKYSKEEPSTSNPQIISKEKTQINTEPNGMGKLKNSRFEERLREQIGEEYPGKQTQYNVLNKDDESHIITDLIAQDPEKAMNIARGLEEAPPGTRQNSFGIAMGQLARDSGDKEMMGALWSKVSRRSTRAGQEIEALKGHVDETQPLNYVIRIMNERKSQLVGKYSKAIESLGVAKDATVDSKATALLDHQVKRTKVELGKREAMIKSITSVLDDITCK